MKVKVFNQEGQDTGREVSLSADVFGVEPNDHVLYLAVKRHQAAQRQGTHKSKERGEITGSRKKIRKQKGSGMARFGDIKNPLFKGGGRVFGPKPRDYDFKLNKKERALAKKSALTYKAKESSIVVVEDLNFEAPSTKGFSSMIGSLGASKIKSLVITDKSDENVHLSARNLKETEVTTSDSVNVYQVMNCRKLIIAESALKSLEANVKAN